jgi:hypothetical protein
MDDHAERGPETDCRKLSIAFQGVLSWKWDSRLKTVLAEFGAGKKDEIRAVLEQSLPVAWDSSNIFRAPDPVRTINDHLGGLWPGQRLLTSDPKGDPLIFCAWWPWGDGKIISIRIAPFYQTLSNPEKAEKIQLLKGWFGI